MFERRTGFLGAVLVVGICTACGGGIRGPSYSGVEEGPRVDAAAVRHLPSLPAGYRALGRISAACKAVADVSKIDRQKLSDVGCTERRMILALEAGAARAGGDALYELACRGNDRNDVSRAKVTCSARVGRAEREPSPRAGDLARSSAHADDPSSLEAWAIRVSFSPAPGVTVRPPRTPELVVEQASIPPSLVALGEVTAECPSDGSGSCAHEAVRVGLRVVAARVGASALLDARCVDRPDSVMCVGTAAGVRAPEADPEAYR